jgi:hypothetical protein
MLLVGISRSKSSSGSGGGSGNDSSSIRKPESSSVDCSSSNSSSEAGLLSFSLLSSISVVMGIFASGNRYPGCGFCHATVR